MNSSLRLRVMTQADLAFADSLRAIAGWNQTILYWQRLLSHESQGCFVAEWEGVPTGTVTTTRYGNDLAWIGMVLVHPDYRRKGIGKALLQRALDYLSRVRCIKLDATPLGKEVYVHFGFQEEWPLTRWELPAWDRTRPSDPINARSNEPMNALASDSTHPSGPAEAKVPDLRPSTLGPRPSTLCEITAAADVDRIDRKAFGVSRASLLDLLIKDSTAGLAENSAEGEILSYGLLREGIRAFYLGPVVGTSPSVSLPLIRALLRRAAGKPIYWDVPDANISAVTLAQELGFVPQRLLLRMFVGKNEHPGEPSVYFGLADPSIG